MRALVAVLVLVAVLGPVTEAQSYKKCQTIQQIIDKTPSLSILKLVSARVPAFTKISTNPKLKATFLAPSNKVLQSLIQQATITRMPLDPKAALQLLLSHIIKVNIDSADAWAKLSTKKIQRYALGPATVIVSVADNFKQKISYYSVTIEAPGYTPIKLDFASNKKYPGIKTCAGTVYIVEQAFVPVL